MDQFESTAQKDVSGSNLNAVSDSLNFDDFECLTDQSSHFHIGDTKEDPFDPLSSNSLSGLVSTTRPLVTTMEDENSLISDISGDKPSVDLGQKKSLIDIDFVDEPLVLPTSAEQHVDESLSIGSGIEARPTDDDSESAARKSSASTTISQQGWGAALDDTEKDQQVGSSSPPPLAEKTNLPKIGTNPVSSEPHHQTESRFPSACKDIAHPTATKQGNTTMEAEATESADCCFSPAVWFNPDKLNPTVAEYVYWRNIKRSSIVFGTILFLLLSMKFFSFISVAAYVTLTVLLITITFRIYKNILQAIQKSNEGHPFKDYLEMDISLSHDKLRDVSEGLIHHVNVVAKKLRSLVLVEDLVDTLKLVIFAYCLTYIGAWFNGMTVMILAFVSAFTLPKVYETNKTQIDTYAEIIITKGKEVMQMVNSKIPLGKKKEE